VGVSTVDLVDYSETWPDAFETERDLLSEALGETAHPPIIDGAASIEIDTTDLSTVDEAAVIELVAGWLVS
jgi:hypothetical protein